MKEEGLTLNVLIFEEVPGLWVAQILEKDMAAHGPSQYAALAAVQLILQAHVNFDTRHNRRPLSRLHPAPQVYWQAYKHADPLPVPSDTPLLLPAHISAAVSREPIISQGA